MRYSDGFLIKNILILPSFSSIQFNYLHLLVNQHING